MDWDAAYTPLRAPGTISAVGKSCTHASVFIVTGATAGPAREAAAGRDDTNDDDGSVAAPLVTKDPVTLTKAMTRGEARVDEGGGGGTARRGRSEAWMRRAG